MRAAGAVRPGLPVLVALLAAASAAVAPVAAQQAGDPRALDAGKALFTGGATPACAVCHTLAHAGSSGAVGPVLDELRPDAARVRAAVANGIGAMPPYRDTLSPAQIDLLSGYVAAVAGR